MYYLIYFSQLPYEISAILIPILQMRELSLKVIKQPDQDHKLVIPTARTRT